MPIRNAIGVNDFAFDAEIRLVGSGQPHEGRLEIKVAGMWGTVCDDSFGNTDAGVACYMLGYGYGIRHVYNTFIHSFYCT